MDMEKWCLRMGAAAVVCAILLRLSSGSALGAVVEALSSPEAVAVMLYLETGRVVRPAQPQAPAPPAQDLPPQETLTQDVETPTQPKEPVQVVFAPGDAALVEVNSVCGYDTNLQALLSKPLIWDLTGDVPTVLILHTHGTESYTKTENYTETSLYRTLNTDYNVVSVGAELKKVLEAGGIQVIHDTTLHDHPSYSSSYSHARDCISEYLKKYPSIVLVLDLHRDAVENRDGKQMIFTTQVDGEKVAQLMMVVGTDANGLKHPNWQENMALAVKLHALLEKDYAGICRPISFRSQRFNQDLSAGAMLIEMGSAGNTRSEALAAARILGQTILKLSQGTEPMI